MSNSVPYLAVCIPTYNRSRYLEKCLVSVINEITGHHLQKDVVVYISDNYSTDDTAAVVEKLSVNTSAIIHYSKNEENIGAVSNFIKLTEICGASYTYILGDDDEVVPGSLVKVLQLIKDNPEVLVHHYKCVQSNFIPLNMPVQKLNAFEAAEKYFYNVGNAGTFIFSTIKAQEVVKENKQRIASTCWPQTEIMFRMLMKESSTSCFLVSGIELVSSENHNENVTYNSWYVIETFCFSLLRVGQHISTSSCKNNFLSIAKKAIPGCKEKVKFFFRFLLFITYYDYQYEVDKTRQLIRQNKSYLQGNVSFYPKAYSLLLALPRWCKKLLVAFYFIVSNRSFKKNKLGKNYAEVKAYQQRKFEVYKQKGKLTEDTERYIY